MSRRPPPPPPPPSTPPPPAAPAAKHAQAGAAPALDTARAELRRLTIAYTETAAKGDKIKAAAQAALENAATAADEQVYTARAAMQRQQEVVRRLEAAAETK